jgi:hypothetical protein
LNQSNRGRQPQRRLALLHDRESKALLGRLVILSAAHCHYWSNGGETNANWGRPKDNKDNNREYLCMCLTRMRILVRASHRFRVAPLLIPVFLCQIHRRGPRPTRAHYTPELRQRRK